MAKLTPTLEELHAMRETAPEGPVVIVNLLRFKPGPAGAQAYQRYRDASVQAGGLNPEILYRGASLGDVGGGAHWDYVIIARYPCFDDFVTKTSDPVFQGEAARHRPDALEETVMLVTYPTDLDAYLAGAARGAGGP